MKPMNEMRMVFASRSANESFARSAVSAFVAQLDPAVDELADLRTAVSEAVTNCIVHAYRDQIGDIYLSAQLFENGRVTVRIRDRGCGIPDVKKAMEPLYTTGGEERSGLGFSVMESFMDNTKVRSTVGKGTTVTMDKYIRVRRRHD
ncbi:MAG: anti-sigma F factor [Acutalibacteraceae bacterium]